MAGEMRRLVAKYPGVCKHPECGEPVKPGDECFFSKEHGVFHLGCAPGGLVPSGASVRPPRRRGRRRGYGYRTTTVAEVEPDHFCKCGTRARHLSPGGTTWLCQICADGTKPLSAGCTCVTCHGRRMALMPKPMPKPAPVRRCDCGNTIGTTEYSACYDCRSRFKSLAAGCTCMYCMARRAAEAEAIAAAAKAAAPAPEKRKCLRCKRVIGNGPGEAQPWGSDDVKNHCRACWMDNPNAYGAPAGTLGATESVAKSQAKADTSLASAMATIEKVGTGQMKGEPEAPSPKQVSSLDGIADRFALIELD